MKTSILTAFAVATLTSAALAGPGKDMPSMTKTPAKGTALVCPVTGTKIASAAKAYNKEVYKGKTYYFCCPECKPRFDKNHDIIIKHATQGKYEKM